MRLGKVVSCVSWTYWHQLTQNMLISKTQGGGRGEALVIVNP